ncbi:unnamed protein product [Ixodes hexagonus]
MGDDSSAGSTCIGKECFPLKALEELLNFDAEKAAPGVAIERLRERVRTPDGPQTLLCHDMMGGYLEDRFLEGSSESDSYRFHHWHHIDTFVYFSHHLVTIPPPGWINAAHRHGVKVLGTFITEWDPGTKILEEIKSSQAVQKVATQLANVAASCGFDGWLINIESALGEDCGPFLEELLSAVTAETHRAVPGSEVIWYDSIVGSGKLRWQNELNEHNGHFFDRCDGIFLNYGWTEEHLERSARFAAGRGWDVYVGVDVWARKTKYAGGYDTHRAVAVARKHGLSAAIFAPGWVFEMEDKALFTENQYRLWDFPSECSGRCKFTTLPISTTFCQGFGKREFQNGKVVKDGGWFNLSRQELQPLDQGRALCNGYGSAVVCVEDGFFGGGCLRLEFTPGDDPSQQEPYFRCPSRRTIFKAGSCSCAFLLCSASSELKAHTKPEGLSSITVDERHVAFDFIPPGSTILASFGCSRVYNAGSRARDNGIPCPRWSPCPQTYLVQDMHTHPSSASLEEIGVQFVKRHHQRCLLGRLAVERPDVVGPQPEDLAVGGKRRRLEEPQALQVR